MNNFIQQIFDILISPPGNLVYHLILAFAVAASLQAALLYRRRAHGLAHRVLLGLGMVLAAQLALFAGSGLAWQQIAEPQRLLPALDRAVIAFSLLWVAWLWCFPKPARLPDALVALLSLAIIIMALFTVNAWVGQDPAAAFNASVYDSGWNLFSLGLAFVAMLVLLLARPPAWETGFSMLGLILAGFVAHFLLVTSNGNFSGIIRLAQLCAYPLLPAVANRLNAPEAARRAEPASPSPQRGEPNPRTRMAWMQVAAETGGEKMFTALARAVAQTLRADLCLLLAAPGLDQNWMLRGGCDLISDQALSGFVLESSSIPALSNALQRGKTIVLSAQSQPTPDLIAIGKVLGLDDAGHLLAVPLISNGKVWGGMILLRPYTMRPWEDSETNALQADAETLLQIVQRAETPAERSQPVPLSVHDQVDAPRHESQPASQRIGLGDTAPSAIAPGDNDSPHQANPLLAEAHALITALQVENESLKEKLRAGLLRAPQANELEQTQGELRITLEEIAYLQNALAKADMKIKTLERSERSERSQPVPQPQDNDLLVAIAQELRQPMSSVTGYCDLLMAESGGTLTALQRSFLERVKTSTERMQTMMDDLVHVAARVGSMAGVYRAVELNDVVDQAVANNSALLRQKNITLRVDLPEHKPALKVNPSALRQILVNLVRNAGSISPDGSTITLRASLEESGRPRWLALRVKDSGGGIPDTQVKDVFNPHFKAGQPLVEGVADSGFGLAVTRELVIAQGGEIEVESDPGKSSTFVVRIPLREDCGEIADVE